MTLTFNQQSVLRTASYIYTLSNKEKVLEVDLIELGKLLKDCKDPNAATFVSIDGVDHGIELEANKYVLGKNVGKKGTLVHIGMKSCLIGNKTAALLGLLDVCKYLYSKGLLISNYIYDSQDNLVTPEIIAAKNGYETLASFLKESNPNSIEANRTSFQNCSIL